MISYYYSTIYFLLNIIHLFNIYDSKMVLEVFETYSLGIYLFFSIGLLTSPAPVVVKDYPAFCLCVHLHAVIVVACVFPCLIFPSHTLQSNSPSPFAFLPFMVSFILVSSLSFSHQNSSQSYSHTVHFFCTSHLAFSCTKLSFSIP